MGKLIDLPTGVKLNYVEQGDPSGVPVLLLHGVTDSWHSFDLVLPHLPSPFTPSRSRKEAMGIPSVPQRDMRLGISQRMPPPSWMP